MTFSPLRAKNSQPRNLVTENRLKIFNYFIAENIRLMVAIVRVYVVRIYITTDLS